MRHFLFLFLIRKAIRVEDFLEKFPLIFVSDPQKLLYISHL
jgi:hypothetical protein